MLGSLILTSYANSTLFISRYRGLESYMLNANLPTSLSRFSQQPRPVFRRRYLSLHLICVDLAKATYVADNLIVIFVPGVSSFQLGEGCVLFQPIPLDL